MICNARVVLIDHGPTSRSSLIAGLEECGCTVESLEPNAASPEWFEAQGPNIVVIGAGETPDSALGTARALKAGGASMQVPIIVLGNVARGDLDSDLVDGVVDDRLPGEALTIEMAARIRSLSRLQVMQSELTRRETIERRYGLSPTPLAAVGSEGMLVLAAGDFSADATALGEVVGAATDGGDSRLAFVDDPIQAIDALGDGHFEVAVVAVNGNGGDRGGADDWLALCGEIRENPRLFNLPILMIADADSFACIAPGSLDTSLSHAAGLSDIAVCHA